MTGSQARRSASPEACRRTKRNRARAGRGHEEPLDPQPAAGHYLLEGIDAAMPLLTPPAQPATVTRQLVDDLRAALARTAARGHTCQVHAAADSVRLAMNLLLTGSTDEARQALRHARTALADAPPEKRDG